MNLFHAFSTAHWRQYCVYTKSFGKKSCLEKFNEFCMWLVLFVDGYGYSRRICLTTPNIAMNWKRKRSKGIANSDFTFLVTTKQFKWVVNSSWRPKFETKNCSHIYQSINKLNWCLRLSPLVHPWCDVTNSSYKNRYCYTR